MYTLYGRRASGSAVVEAMLELAGVGYRMESVPPGDGRQATAAFRALNPLGQVPTLVMPDGAVMAESAAIVIHLADCFPALNLSPATGTPARAQYLRWMLFLAASLYPSNIRAYYGERYTADPAGGDQVKQEAYARVAREWAVYGQALGQGPFILGDTMSAADLYAAMLASWNLDLDDFWRKHPNIKAMYDRVKAIPAIGRVWERNDM